MPTTPTPRKIQFSDFKWIFDYKIIVATGTILLFIYFLKIGYYPSSFDIGDTTVIFLVVFGFGIVVLFTILLYFILAYAIYSCYHAQKKGNKIEFWVMLISISLGILILIGFMYYFKLQFSVYSYGLLLAFGIVLLSTFMIETDNEEDFFICTFILYILVCAMPFSLPIFKISTIMEMVGVAKNNVAIQIDEKELIKIKDMSEKLKIPLLHGCNEYKDIYNMEVLWHGIGSYALLKFPNTMNDNTDRTIIVKNDTLSFSSNTFSSGCIIYDIDELPMHSKNENEVKEKIRVKVEEKLIDFMKENKNSNLIKENKNSDLILDKIVITGFSDKRDTKNKLNNYELSKQRAEYAKDVLCEMEWESDYLKDKKNEFCKRDSNKIEVKGSGRKYANEKCEYLSHQKYRAKKYQSELDECFAPDRKVEFKFEFISDKSKQDETKKDK